MRSGGRREDARRYGNGMPARCRDVAQRRGEGRSFQKPHQASERRTDDSGIPLTHIPLQSGGAALGEGRAGLC